jgi:hypothetical protein
MYSVLDVAKSLLPQLLQEMQELEGDGDRHLPPSCVCVVCHTYGSCHRCGDYQSHGADPVGDIFLNTKQEYNSFLQEKVPFKSFTVLVGSCDCATHKEVKKLVVAQLFETLGIYVLHSDLMCVAFRKPVPRTHAHTHTHTHIYAYTRT